MLSRGFKKVAQALRSEIGGRESVVREQNAL